MGKYADSLDDYCPECANADGSEQNNLHLNSSSGESDCCCCCCCDCSEEDNLVTTANGNVENSADHKKDLLSNLSMSRTIGQPASIQNILQFIEALTNSRSFLSQYYLRENFCLDCLTEPVCDCYARSLSNQNGSNTCTCVDCVLEGEPNALHGIESNVSDGPESSVSKVAAPRRSDNRNSERRRRRRRVRRSRQHTSDTSDQTQSRNNRHHPESSYDNSQPSERENVSSRYRRRTRRCPPNTDQYCNCDECSPRTTKKSNEASCTCIFPNSFQPQNDNSSDRCPECTSNFCSSADNKCELSDCELCNLGACETLDDSETCCSDCTVLKPETSACNCCNSPHQSSKGNFKSPSDNEKIFSNDLKSSTEHVPQDKYPDDDKSACGSCDCQECRNDSECSDGSCDECRNRSTKNNDGKSRKN